MWLNGRRVFHSFNLLNNAVKEDLRGLLERVEVRMLAQVTAMMLRTHHAERSRFPWQ